MKIIIGITGASGFIYGYQLLKQLKELEVETHLVISKSGELTQALESSISRQELRKLSSTYYNVNDISAAIASGSYQTDGMIIAPCSMKTLAEIATGLSQSLLTRAADVILKERKKLVLMTRETPLNLIHLENMKKVTEMGGIIAPPVPAFYNKPSSLDDVVNHSVGRVLDLFSLVPKNIKRWGG
jgi:4-hydroxy-3-polyprenylbenzoate decarboxylase